MIRPASAWMISAVLVAGSAAWPAAAAPPPGPQDHPPPPEARDRPEPPSIAERLARLRALLQLSPAQDGAAQAFLAAATPPERPGPPGAERGGLRGVPTPERLDRLAAMRAAAGERMDKAASATRAFYASLNPSQKAAFDLMPPPLLLGFGPPAPEDGPPGPRP